MQSGVIVEADRRRRVERRGFGVKYSFPGLRPWKVPLEHLRETVCEDKTAPVELGMVLLLIFCALSVFRSPTGLHLVMAERWGTAFLLSAAVGSFGYFKVDYTAKIAFGAALFMEMGWLCVFFLQRHPGGVAWVMFGGAATAGVWIAMRANMSATYIIAHKPPKTQIVNTQEDL